MGSTVPTRAAIPRFQCFITDRISGDLPAFEADHRQHAQVEDRVKTLPARRRRPTQACSRPQRRRDAARLELALTTTDILAWTQTLTSTVNTRRASPSG